MDRPNLQRRVPDAITRRLPVGGSDDEGTDVVGPNADDGDSDSTGYRRWTTALTLSGLGLAGLGVALRYVLGKRRADDSDDGPDRSGPDTDRDAAGTVEIVGDADTTEVAGPGTDESIDGDETDLEEREEADERDGPSAAMAGTEPDATVVTYGSDRPASGDADHRTVSAAEPPRIAPLVGMVSLVGIRLFVERVRKRTA